MPALTGVDCNLGLHPQAIMLVKILKTVRVFLRSHVSSSVRESGIKVIMKALLNGFSKAKKYSQDLVLVL